MLSEEEICQAISRHGDTVRRICLVHLKNHADTEDVFQTVFLKYVLSSKQFENEEHERAWFIRVTLNACRDLLRDFFRQRTVPLEELYDLPADAPPDTALILDAVLSLPKKLRTVVYLHYYEGYTAPQIGALLHKNVNTIYTHLSRAKALLRERLGGDWDEG